MKTSIRAEKDFSYDDRYTISIDTTKELSSEEYGSLLSAIHEVQIVIDGYLDTLVEKAKKEGPKNNG